MSTSSCPDPRPGASWRLVLMRTLLALACLVCGAAAAAQGTRPPAPPTSNRQAFTLTQSISDEAQLKTIAFSGLAMMTGSLEAQSFFPPGKVADYTGFQYLRDNDPDDMGHNTSFLTRVANNVIHMLDTTQFNQLEALAVSQMSQIDEYGYKRYPLMKAFRRLLDEQVPSGSPGLDLAAVKKASRDLYAIDGQISFDRALLYAAVIKSFTAQQRAYLDAMKGKGWKSWPDITNAQVDARMRGLPQGTSVAVMTYASDLFSWYAGSVEADVYFCPERHGTYYGGFYIKDAPAIGHEGYSINEQLTATAGEALSDSAKGYVTPAQADLMGTLVELQRDNLYASPTANIVVVRTAIATALRTLLDANVSPAAVKARVLQLSEAYGDLDGENNYNYATVFARVYHSLSSAQLQRLMTLRRSIMSGRYADGTPFDFTVCATPFLYSAVIPDSSVLDPYVSNTDYLFHLAPGFRSAYYFAEGATIVPFECRFALLNPSTTAAAVQMRFMRTDGAAFTFLTTLPALSRYTLDARTVEGLESAQFSTVVSSDQAIVADRTMTWGPTAYGAHAETAIAEPSTHWYLAEGSTAAGFQLFYLLQNPGDAEAVVRVRYLRPAGAPLEKTYRLPPTSRTNIWVNLETFDELGMALASTDVSADVLSLDDAPIIVERAMYLDVPGQPLGASHEAAGVTDAAEQWYLAEGATGPFFDLFILVANPGASDADVEASFLLPDGATVTRRYTVPATSRYTIWVDQEDPRLADTAVSSVIRTTNGAPIVVERSMWWPAPSWYEAHDSAGAVATGTVWAVAEGEVGGARDVDTFILVANTSDEAALAKVTLVFENGDSVSRSFTVGAHSRFNVDARTEFVAANGRRFGAIVESEGAAPAALVVERAMYWSVPGQPWAAGTNSLATRLR